MVTYHAFDEFPKTSKEWVKVNTGFTTKSSEGIMTGCIGAVDGYLQHTQTPGNDEVGNVTAYYLGH